MDQVLEFLAENYIYVAGGSAVVIVILLIIIAFGNKKNKKGKNIQEVNNFVNAPNMDSAANVNMGIPEPVLESVPVMEPQMEMPAVEPVQESPVEEKKEETLEIFDL